MSHRGSQTTRVCIIGDRHVIETNARRAEAILLVLSGATLQEVGDRFGVTRERIRQYLKDAGLTTSDRKRYSPRDVDAARWDRARMRHTERQARIRRLVTFLRDFAVERGRAPTYGELYQFTFGVPAKSDVMSRLATHLGRRRGRRASGALHALYRLAGVDVRPLGALGHREAA